MIHTISPATTIIKWHAISIYASLWARVILLLYYNRQNPIFYSRYLDSTTKFTPIYLTFYPSINPLLYTRLLLQSTFIFMYAWTTSLSHLVILCSPQTVHCSMYRSTHRSIHQFIFQDIYPVCPHIHVCFNNPPISSRYLVCTTNHTPIHPPFYTSVYTPPV